MTELKITSIEQQLDELIATFRNAAASPLDEQSFIEFEAAIGKLPEAHPDKITHYLHAGESLMSRMVYEKAGQYLEQGLSIARQQGKLSEQALTLGALAELARVQGDYRLAFCHIDDALEVLTQVKDDVVLARLLILAGLNDISLGMYDSAVDRFYRAYALYTKLNDNTGITLAMIRLGTAHMMQIRYAEAEKWLIRSLAMCDIIGDKHLKAGTLTNLGEIARVQNQYDRSYKNYEQANALFSELGVGRGVAITTNNMAHLAIHRKEYALAVQLYNQAFQTITQYGLIPEMLDTLAGMCLLLNENGNVDITRQITQKLINCPILLDESRQLLAPVIDKFKLEPGDPEMIHTRQLKELFIQATQALPTP